MERQAPVIDLVTGPAFSIILSLRVEGGGADVLARRLVSSLLFSLFLFFLASDALLFGGGASLAMEVGRP